MEPRDLQGQSRTPGLRKPRKVSLDQTSSGRPASDVPTIMAELRELTSTTALCLRFTIPTWTRSSEARAAVWEEIDTDQQLWTIPGRRMKAGREHVIPLSEEAREILTEMSRRRHEGSSAIFPGARGGLLSGCGNQQGAAHSATVRRLDAAATEKLRANLPVGKNARTPPAMASPFMASGPAHGRWAPPINFPREVLGTGSCARREQQQG
ncbi:MAG: tyrosine-type recombinase/integrase [Hyphomonadaceae bacterium]|nr:tyrosine-type recombinase/integrase [Hyphomonadaceae bacterium]